MVADVDGPEATAGGCAPVRPVPSLEMLADVVAVIGTQDIVFGEIDR